GDDAGGDRDTGAHAFSPETSPFFHSAPALSGEPPFVGESRSYENGQEPRETQEPERAAQGGAFDSDQSQSPQRGYAEEPPEAQQYPSRSPAPQGYGTGPFQRDPNAPPRGRAEPPPYPPSHTPDPQPYAGDPHEEQASPTYSDPPYAYPPAEVPFTGAPLYEAGPWPEIHPTEPPLFPGGPFRSSADGQAPQPPDQASSPYGSAPTYGQPAPQPETSDSLSPETLLRGRRRAPSHGWRRAVYRASGGLVRPGESPAELRHRQLVARARTPVAGGHHRVAVLSLKGGVGKTTTTVALGSCLASLRGDRAIAVDANPDRGTLSDKVRLETAATVRDLLNERSEVHRYADVRAFTSQAPSRLEVLASDRDPAVSEAFSEADYQAVAQVLEHFYSICLTDCGTGLLHSAMSGVLRLANQIVVVSSPSVDGARSASATLDWLEAHEYGDLVRTATVVLSAVRENSKSSVDLDRLEQHFASRSNAVIRVPYDPHLEEGAEVDLERLKSGTRDAYLTLAATVGDGFGRRR
ncbi:MAG: AAA family ATPase, partial [Streptosporangiaceae bacterium]